MAEIRAVLINANRDPKRRPSPVTAAEIAPWTVPLEERLRMAETPVDAGYAAALREQALAAHKRKRQECQQDETG